MTAIARAAPPEGLAARITFARVFIVLLGLTAGVGFATLFAHRAADPFFYATLQDALAISNGRPPVREIDGYMTLVSMVQTATAIDPLLITGLPVGMIILPLAFAALLRRLAAPTWLVATMAFFVSLDFTHALTNGTMFAYGWSRYLFVLFVYVVVVASTQELQSWRWVLVLILIYAGMTVIHYTAPYWAILFFLVYAFVAAPRAWTQHRWSTPLLLFVIYIIAYIGNQVTRRVLASTSGAESSVLQKAGDLLARASSILLGGEAPVRDPAVFHAPAFTFVGAFTLFALAGLAWAFLLYRLFKRPEERKNPVVIVPVILGFVSLFHGISYGLIVGLRVDEVFVLMLPLFFLPFLEHPIGRRIVAACAGAILLVLALQSVAYYATFEADSEVPELPAAHRWALAHVDQHGLTADGALQYQLGFMDEVQHTTLLTYKMRRPWFDELRMGYPVEGPAKMLLVNMRSEQSVVLEEPRLKGFVNYEQALDHNPGINKVLDLGEFRAYVRTDPIRR